MPPYIRPAMLALAGFHLALTLLGALAANFADGGDAVSRLLLTFAFPAAAIALIVFVATPRPSRAFALAIACVMAANLAIATGIAIAIASGAVNGQWWMPMTFAIIPTIAIPYALTLPSPKPLRTA